MTKLPASVGIATTGDAATTGASPGVTTAAIPAVVVVVRDAVISARNVEPVVEETASVVSAAGEDVTGIAIRDRANCLSRRKACA